MRLYAGACSEWEISLRDEQGHQIDPEKFDEVEVRFATGGPGAYRTLHVLSFDMPPDGTVIIHTEPGFYTEPGLWFLHPYLRKDGHLVPCRELAFTVVEGVPPL